jgi:hypothetical protein
MKINFISGSAVITAFIALIFAAATHAEMVQSESTVPYKSITPRVESTIERTAIIALRHISQARSDIHRKTLTNARRELAEASRLMESIRNDLSTTTTKNLIQIARKHLEYEPAQQVLRDLPPVYSSLDMISIYLPTDKAKAHLDRAKSYLEKNDKKGAAKELALANSSLIVVEVELPLLRAQRFVTKADGYLAAKKGKNADEALQAAERRTISLSTSLNSPLFQAKQNIWLAFRNYSTAGHANTGSYLEQARSYLEKAAANGSAKGKEEAGKLSREVAELEKKVAGEGKVAESELKSAWEKSKALGERSAAYLSADIAEEETTLKEENSLIEAKLHVAYAETYQVTTMESNKAARELDTAYSYLQKAANSSLVDPSDRKKMHKIISILQELKANPAKNDALVQERYETVKKELTDLSVKEKLLDENKDLTSIFD